MRVGEWILINNMIKMRKILLVVNTLRSSSQIELRNQFNFSGEASEL